MATRRKGAVSEDGGNRSLLQDAADAIAAADPHAIDAEQQLIGAFQIDPMSIDQGMVLIKPEHFHDPRYMRIAKAIFSLREKMKEIDLVSIRRELIRIYGEGEQVGVLVQAALECMENTNHAAHVEYHCGEVKKAHIKRQFIQWTTESIRKAQNQSTDIAELLASSEQRLIELMETGTANEATSITQVLMEVFDEQQKERRSGIKTHYGELDNVIDGLMPGTLTVLAARPSMGKTALALNIARNVCKAGAKVLFFSLEQPQRELGERLLSMEATVPIHSMRHREVDEIEDFALLEASNRLGQMQLMIDGRSYMSPTTIASTSRMVKRRHGVDVVIIDYLQLIEPDDPRMPREQQVATCSRRLKGLAKDLDIPVIILAQLNRQVENRDDKAPRLSDLRESGAIEQDADQVWFVWRPEVYEAGKEPGVAYIKVAKNRNGPLGSVKFVFRASYFRFDVMANADETEWQDKDEYNWGHPES